MSFLNILQEIEEQGKKRREAERRLSLTMEPYDQEFLAEDTRKELFSMIANAKSDVAVDVISNLDEVGISDLKTDDKKVKSQNVTRVNSTVKKSNVDILLRVDVPKTISAKMMEEKTTLPSITDIIASSPDGKVKVRRLKRILEKEKKPYDS